MGANKGLSPQSGNFFYPTLNLWQHTEKKSPELYFQMETLLDKQEVIFQKLESTIKLNI